MVGNESDSSRATVTTTATACQRCGTRTVSSYHDGDCGGLVVRVGDEWRCADCGVAIGRSATCPECGASGVEASADVEVSLRPPVATTAVEDALLRAASGRVGGVDRDELLSTTARAHVHADVEREFFGGRGRELSDRLESLSVPLSGYQFRTIRAYPDAETPEGIAREVVDGFAGDLGGETDGDWTHLGAGAAFDPRGGLHVALVLAERTATGYDVAGVERAVHEAVNARRRTRGLPLLSFDGHLAAVARTHSRDMARRGFFDHETPDGRSVADRYRQTGYDPRPSGENIAKQYPTHGADAGGVAESVVESWMNSPGHRENIVESSWTNEGVGAFRADDGALYVTQNFS